MPPRTPRKPAGAESSTFVRAMRRIAESTDKITHADLQALSKADATGIAEFRAEWPKLPPARQRALLAAMEDAAEESVQSEFSDLLLTLLDEPDEIVRAAAVSGLWELETPSFGKRLLKMVAEDKSAHVRAAAAAGLGAYLQEAEEDDHAIPSSKPIIDSLLERFHDPNEDLEVRRRALESVAFAGDERAHSAIQEAYDDGDKDMRVSALFAMGRSYDTSWTPIVLRELKNSDESVRYDAAVAAGELSATDALPQLIKMVQDSSIQVREAAIWSLGQIGGREARRVLEAVLESDDEELQEAAEDALAELEFAEGIDTLNLFDFEVANLDDLDEDDEADDDSEPEPKRPN